METILRGLRCGFDKRKTAAKDFKRGLQENLKEREQLCAEIEAAKPPKLERAQLKIWQSRWRELGEAPKARAEKINARFRKALESAEKTIAQTEKSAQKELQELLLQKSAICASLENCALAENPESAETTELKKQWAKLPELPGETETAIYARYKVAEDSLRNSDARAKLRETLAENLRQLHALVLQLEILCEQNSPPEFAKQRMQLQVARLAVSMGKTCDKTKPSAAVSIKTAEQLIREILLTGAVDKTARESVMARLESCRAQEMMINKTSSASKSSPPKTSKS